MGTLTISIDRTGMTPSTPLILSANEDANVWGILPGFTPPAEIPRVRYAGSAWGRDVATGMNWQQGIIACDVAPKVTDAAALTTAKAELRAALARLSFLVTITENGQATTWECSPSAPMPASMDVDELDSNEPVYALNIPCYPVGA